MLRLLTRDTLMRARVASCHLLGPILHSLDFMVAFQELGNIVWALFTSPCT
jgi:hypothetical protein